jgi:hypothetical protein
LGLGTISLAVTLVIILAVTLAPFVPLAGSSYTSCGKTGCKIEFQYGSVTYALFGVGSVYDTHGFYYLRSSRMSPTVGGSTYASSISPDGLQLVITLNTTKVGFHGAIAAQVYVLNTLGTNTSLSTSMSDRINYYEEFDSPVCPGALSTDLVGFALFMGHYSPANISRAGRPLHLGAPLLVECPAAPFPNRVVFLLYSDNAVAYFSRPRQYVSNGSLFAMAENVATGTCGPSPAYGFTCNDGESLYGYWTVCCQFLEPTSSMLRYFEYFQPSEYTLVAADTWNQTVYASFEVY